VILADVSIANEENRGDTDRANGSKNLAPARTPLPGYSFLKMKWIVDHIADVRSPNDDSGQFAIEKKPYVRP
jgi:hypothetical protein